MRWINGLIGWLKGTRRDGRLLRHMDAFHAAVERERDPLLADLVRTGFWAWREGWGEQALAALDRERREFRRRKAS